MLETFPMGIILPESWIIAIDNIERYFRAGWNVSVFSEGPGRIAPLPPALGGDPSTWEKLTSFAAYKSGLLNIVLAKAHYLLLPYTSLSYVKQNSHIGISRFIFDSGDASGVTSAIPALDVALLIRVPAGTDEAIVRVFTDLGRRGRPGTLSSQDALATVYHEATHAWMLDSRDEDSEMSSLFDEGVKAFAGATGSSGAKLDPFEAFVEASASYVEKRVLAWGMALYRLNVARFARDEGGDPEAFRRNLLNYINETVGNYNAAYDVQTYGHIGEDDIVSPPLSATLREKLDAKLLDNQPLVGRFEQTQLGEILAGT
jgi:hypothetical protein